MRSDLRDPRPSWVDGIDGITAPGGPFPSAWRWLLAAANSSPAALRAALASYAILLGEEGLPQAQARALEARRTIDLDAPDPKVEHLASTLADGRPALVVTAYAATVLYLRDRLADRSPAWCTRCLAGWKHSLLPRDRVLDWFRTGAPEVAPWTLIARAPLRAIDLGRAELVVHYDHPAIASP